MTYEKTRLKFSILRKAKTKLAWPAIFPVLFLFSAVFTTPGIVVKKKGSPLPEEKNYKK